MTAINVIEVMGGKDFSRRGLFQINVMNDYEIFGEPGGVFILSCD